MNKVGRLSVSRQFSRNRDRTLAYLLEAKGGVLRVIIDP
jgi:hypothetical protein